MQVAVLVPVKRFGAAKARLTSVLEPTERAQLARWMASGVLEAVRPAPTFVACDDSEVAEWAESLGAGVIWGQGLGLNGAVNDGIARIVQLEFDHVLVTHADVPRPRHLAAVPRADCVTLVPDRRRDGTNVMAFPARTPLTAAYGAGSFVRHLRQALGLSGVGVEVRTDPDLALDLDTPDDLGHPLISGVLPAWLQTILASR
jgi:2-phospho-L-lactate guanylyltransferase